MVWWRWLVVVSLLGGLFALDLGYVARRRVTPSGALRWSGIWLAAGLGFTAVVWSGWGGPLAGGYLGGYLIERVLSIDNLAALFALLAGAGAPLVAQSRALSFGLVGALALRCVLIVAGLALLSLVPGLAVVLGTALVVTGIRMGRPAPDEAPPPTGRAVRWMGTVLPVTEEWHGAKFVVRVSGRRLVTPLVPLVAGVVVADVIFALDSVTAILSITRVTWVIIAANAFALLGLRPLYFVFAGLVDRLRYLRHGLGAILVVAGIFLGLDEFVALPVWLELGTVVGILAVAVTASLVGGRPTSPRVGRRR